MANNHPKGRSIAIWGETRNPESATADTMLNIHFNYWHIRSQKSDHKKQTDFFDIGVMATACKHLSRVLIHIPLVFDATAVEDLGGLFSNPTIASGIFNESLSATTSAHSPHITLTRGSNDFTKVYVFTSHQEKISENELRVVSDESGTLIEICDVAISDGFTGLNGKNTLYFRIRIRVPPSGHNPFSRVIKPTDSWLLSSFDYTEFLDFRLNEARNLPRNITQRMWPSDQPTLAGAPPISRIDYLVVVGEAADVAAGVESNKRRILENELWEGYTNTPKGNPGKLSEGMVIYHWKKVPEKTAVDIGDFGAFIKLKIRRSGLSLVSRYLFVVALIGCSGSLLASFAWARFDMDKWVKSSDSNTQDSLSALSNACAQAVDQACRKDISSSRPVSGKSKAPDHAKGTLTQTSGDTNK